jgi:hypothetical protein
MMRVAAVLCAAFLLACERGDSPADRPPAGQPAAQPDAVDIEPQQQWPGPGTGPIHVRRERRHDLTGDGRPETVTVAARGPHYDALDITLVIANAAGDTLWTDAWRSDYYFHYEPIEGQTAEQVAAVVQGHVDDAVSGRRFQRGMPDGMIGGDPAEMMRESVRYHLAELDWRRRVDLEPSDPTPQEAWQRIDPQTVVNARAQAVVDELLQGPTYLYFAGGEASYVIGWSVREQAFVRLFACC